MTQAKAYDGGMQMRFLASIFVALLFGYPASAGAFIIPTPTQVTVYEYYNTNVNRYVLLNDPTEIAAVESGAAGPGWQRTQYSFLAYSVSNLASFPTLAKHSVRGPATPKPSFAAMKCHSLASLLPSA